ncbi:TPA: hypothetical protein ACGHOZ_003860 [Salmonella enterica subsp. enterica serovar Onderstepoort]
MSNVLRILFFSAVCALNIVILITWVIPVLNTNLNRGYYDAFSFISVLCGNNPDNSVIQLLNINNYNGVLFVMLMSPGIITSWIAFFTVYKFVLLDVPLFSIQVIFPIRTKKQQQTC